MTKMDEQGLVKPIILGKPNEFVEVLVPLGGKYETLKLVRRQKLEQAVDVVHKPFHNCLL